MISEASSITYPTSEKGSIFSLTTHHLPIVLESSAWEDSQLFLKAHSACMDSKTAVLHSYYPLLLLIFLDSLGLLGISS